MPEAMERSLRAEAEKHGYLRGSRRYNSYVYGTLQKFKKHNHAGWLGPDKIFRNKGKHMKDIIYLFHIGAIAFGIIALWILFGVLEGGSGSSSNIPSYYDPNLNYDSWSDYQRNSYGANAGILEGEAN